MDLIAIAMFVRCALMHVCISLILIFVCVVVVYVFSSCPKLGYMTYRTNRSWGSLLFGVSHCARRFWWSTGIRIYQGIPTRGLSFLHSSPVFGTLGTYMLRWRWFAMPVVPRPKAKQCWSSKSSLKPCPSQHLAPKNARKLENFRSNLGSSRLETFWLILIMPNNKCSPI